MQAIAKYFLFSRDAGIRGKLRQASGEWTHCNDMLANSRAILMRFKSKY